MKDLGQGTVDVSEYNRYCHFVAGLVGEGLSRLFVATKLEDPSLEKDLFSSDQMGLFLQKTNIIRDYLEDYVDGRAFWPQSIWKVYSKSGDLGYFAYSKNSKESVASLRCLNDLVLDALQSVPHVLGYLSQLKNQEVFRFCAIPQAMAIATLSKLHDNEDVFTGVVKIRKGMACKIILNTNNMKQIAKIFNKFSKKILSKTETSKSYGTRENVSYIQTITICKRIIELTNKL